MRIYNTLTKQKEELVPIKDKKVNLFVCGPTVYDYSHLGHAKTYTQFDFIVRYLRSRGFDVFYLQNITDIDDKILNRARETKSSWKELSQKFEKLYFEDMRSLHNTSVSKYARATDYIEQIIKQVKKLIEKGYAYKISDGIYFEISKFSDYGKLSGRTELKRDDSMSRIDENKEKRGWNDFCLWKFSKPDEPAWPSDIGDGRPGWHIEDTAITESNFGPQYDIHGGAVDLVIPHHEAEIAQMESASGLKPLVRYWMHTGFLNINNEKMSKSKGNFTTIQEALKEYNYRSLRFLFISNHYRSPLNFERKFLDQAKESLKRIDEFVFSLKSDNLRKDNLKALNNLKDSFYSYIDDDFNTPSALGTLFDFIRSQNAKKMGGRKTLEFLEEINLFFDFMLFETRSNHEIELKVKQRDKFRSEGKFEEADKIRLELEKTGVKIYDAELGTSWRKVN